MPLPQFYNQEHLGLTFQELLSECTKLLDSLQVTAEEAAAIEVSTRKQSSSKEWFQQRAGRITASKFKSACATNPDKPSKSLMKGICYPDAHRFSNAATKWGIEKEPDSEFIKSCTTRAKDFCLRGVLPELLGKWFTRSSAVQPVELPLSDSEEEGIWCSCQQHIEDSQLIGCDNANCPIQWFHLPCVGLTVVPEDKWFCSSCTK